MPGSDIDDAHWAALFAQLAHGQAQQLFGVHLALANAPPADGVQVVAVDQPANRRAAGWRVAVHVIQGAARVEAGLETQFNASRDTAAEAHAGPRGAPVEIARRVLRQRRRQFLGFGTTPAHAVGFQQRRTLQRLLEGFQYEAANTAQRMSTVTLAQGVVEEPGQDVHFLVQAAQALEELLLGFAVHHEVAAGDQQLGGNLNRLGIGDHALGGVVQAQQHVHRNGAGDQRVVIERGDALGIVAEELGFDVTVDEEIAAPGAHQLQAWSRQRYVQLHLECRRGEHQCADLRRVIMGPGGNHHGANALRQHHHVPGIDVIRSGDMVDKGLHIAHAGGEARAVAPRPRRFAVATGIPGEEIEALQAQLFDQMGHAAAMLVTAMKHHDGTTSCPGLHIGSGPMAVEQADAVVGREGVGANFSHQCIPIAQKKTLAPDPGVRG